MGVRRAGAFVLTLLLMAALAASASAQQPSPGGPNSQVFQYAPPPSPPPPGGVAPFEQSGPVPVELVPAVLAEEGCTSELIAAAAAPPYDGVEDELAFTGFGLLALLFVGVALLAAGAAIYGIRRSRRGFALARVPLALLAVLVVAAALGAAVLVSPSQVLGIDLAQSEASALSELPGPVVGETVNLVPCGANATVKTPGAGSFESVGLPEQVPVGTKVNTRRTPVVMVSAVPPEPINTSASIDGERLNYELTAVTEGATRMAKFSEGKFKIRQKKKGRAVTEALMTGKQVGCGADDERKARGRELWGDGEGLHRIRGELASATVRGTRFRVKDLCDGSTKVRVAEGQVSVKDLKEKSSELLDAGESTRVEP